MNHIVDEQWKTMQLKTFTKWMNARLKKADLAPIDDLYAEARTGSPFVRLFRALGKGDVQHTPNPRSRIAMMENIKFVLDFLQSQSIRLVNIGSTDIVDGDEKLILGLVWTIISRMSMSESFSGSGAAHGAEMLKWVRRVTSGYGNVDITNFTTSWSDGLGFSALINYFRPECLDYAALSSETPRENLERAFAVAEKSLGIPKLLDADDIVSAGVPDEKSIMTYVYEYYKKFKDEEAKMACSNLIGEFMKARSESLRLRNEYDARAEAHCAKKTELAARLGSVAVLAKQLSHAVAECAEQTAALVVESSALALMLSAIHDVERLFNLRCYVPPEHLALDQMAVPPCNMPALTACVGAAAERFNGPELRDAEATKDACDALCAVSSHAEQHRRFAVLQGRLGAPGAQSGSLKSLGLVLAAKEEVLAMSLARSKREQAVFESAAKLFKQFDVKGLGTVTHSDLRKIAAALDFDPAALLPPASDAITVEVLFAALKRSYLAPWNSTQLRAAFAALGEDGFVSVDEAHDAELPAAAAGRGVMYEDIVGCIEE